MLYSKSLGPYKDGLAFHLFHSIKAFSLGDKIAFVAVLGQLRFEEILEVVNLGSKVSGLFLARDLEGCMDYIQEITATTDLFVSWMTNPKKRTHHTSCRHTMSAAQRRISLSSQSLRFGQLQPSVSRPAASTLKVQMVRLNEASEPSPSICHQCTGLSMAPILLKTAQAVLRAKAYIPKVRPQDASSALSHHFPSFRLKKS